MMDKKIEEIINKPKNKLLPLEDVEYLKSKIPKSNWRIKYAFYNKESKKGAYVVFIIDGMPYSPRRSGVENNWEIFCERAITNIEYDELINNYGCNNRKFCVWNYTTIEALQEDDKKYHIDTPEKFVNEAKRRGYSGNIQLALDLNQWKIKE